MKAVNIEIKAKCDNPEGIRNILLEHGARFVGKDHQIDTYFKVADGRLKLRQGEIENALIYYKRDNQSGPKQSDIKLYRPKSSEELKELLSSSLGVQIVVDKQREIYFIDNVKFHLDTVQGLGDFVEIEAIDEDDTHSIDDLRGQCDAYLKLLDIQPQDLVSESYSDLIKTRVIQPL